MRILKNYGLPFYYRGKKSVPHFDDLGFADEYQLSVYLSALGLMKKHGLKSVADVGCGSGYKLMTYFDDYDTIGMEVANNIPELRKRYPGRKFAASDFNNGEAVAADVVICSDVIEHLPDPDELLHFLRRASFRFLVLSTPWRRATSRFYFKPWYFLRPRNVYHFREWTKKEFARYVSAAGFNIIQHFGNGEGQTVICKGGVAEK